MTREQNRCESLLHTRASLLLQLESIEKEIEQHGIVDTTIMHLSTVKGTDKILPITEHFAYIMQRMNKDQNGAIWTVRNNTILVFCMRLEELGIISSESINGVALDLILQDKQFDPKYRERFTLGRIASQLSKLRLLPRNSKSRMYTVDERKVIQQLLDGVQFTDFKSLANKLNTRSVDGIVQQMQNTIARGKAEYHLAAYIVDTLKLEYLE